ncbi:MAG: hypothetical protein WAN35_00435, partial [Terracidiphilus sp.]
MAVALVFRLGVLAVVSLFAGRLVSMRVLAAPAKQFQVAIPSQGPLHTITTARQAHDLSSAEAICGYPIHLRGVVTYFDTDTGQGFGALFIHDGSGSIFVKIAGGAVKSLPIGTVIDVRGISNIGGFAPIVDQPQFQPIGHAPLPKADAFVSRSQIFAADYEGQWVGVEGVVHSVTATSHQVTLQLAMMDGILFATTVREPGVDYSRLM